MMLLQHAGLSGGLATITTAALLLFATEGSTRDVAPGHAADPAQAISTILNSDAAQAAAQNAQIQRDKYMRAAAKALADKDYARAKEHLKKLEALGGDLPASIDYFRGEAFIRTGNHAAGLKSINRYFERTGAKGRYYQQALDLSVEAEESVEKDIKRLVSLLNRKNGRAGATIRDRGSVCTLYTDVRSTAKRDSKNSLAIIYTTKTLSGGDPTGSALGLRNSNCHHGSYFTGYQAYSSDKTWTIDLSAPPKEKLVSVSACTKGHSEDKNDRRPTWGCDSDYEIMSLNHRGLWYVSTERDVRKVMKILKKYW